MKPALTLLPWAFGVILAFAGCGPVEPAPAAAGPKPAAEASAARTAPLPPASSPRAPGRVPRLVDLGAKKCVPCKQMVPVLDALTTEYAGRLEVVFIDVGENRAEGARHGIRLIPTQIFYDADGRELARHEGYWPKEAIVARFREAGVDLDRPPPTEAGKVDR